MLISDTAVFVDPVTSVRFTYKDEEFVKKQIQLI